MAKSISSSARSHSTRREEAHAFTDLPVTVGTAAPATEGVVPVVDARAIFGVLR